jgi:hypothetical protein
MFGAVASLRKEISPQAKRRKSTPLVRTPFTSLMASTSNGKAESTSNAFLSVQLSRTSCELTKNEAAINYRFICYYGFITVEFQASS